MKRSSALRHRVLLAFVLLSGIAGCSESDGLSVCADHPLLQQQKLPDGATRRCQVKIEAQVAVDAAGEMSALGVISLAAVDVTQLTLVARPADLQFCEQPPCSCFALTGKPAESCAPGDSACAPKDLDVEGLTLSGVASTLVPTKTGPGRFTAVGPTDALFTGGQVGVAVANTGAANQFPAYAQQLDPPDPLILQRIGSDYRAGERVPTVSMRDLELGWVAGNGAAVEVVLRIDRPGDSDVVVCVVEDDGCHHVPEAALRWLAASAAPEQRLSLLVRRHRAAITAINPTTVAQLKVQRRIQFSLRREQ